MEENKNNPNANAQGQGQNQNPNHGQGRRRRRKHKGGNGGNNNAVQAQGQVQEPIKQSAPAVQTPKQSQQPSAQQPKQNQQKQGKKKQKQQTKQPDDGRKDTYAYTLDGNLYINLTNKCSNGCDFCVRNERTSYYGNYLWLQKGEPTAVQVIAQINGLGDLTKFKEGVFCGFGEPTYRMEVMREVADYLHEKGISTRLNTNGQGNLINKRDIVPELIGKIDLVNVSLNASCYEKYQKICRSMFREAGFDGMVEFAKSCKRQGVNVRFSIVDCIGEEEVEACKRLASSVNVPLYIRDYITDS